MGRVIGILRTRGKRLRDIYAIFLAFMDTRVPVKARVFAAAVVLYTLLPFDFLPEYLPFVGIIDDLLVVSTGIAMAMKMVPEPIMEEYKLKADSAAGKWKWVLWLLVGLAVVWIALIVLMIYFIVR